MLDISELCAISLECSAESLEHANALEQSAILLECSADALELSAWSLECLAKPLEPSAECLECSA